MLAHIHPSRLRFTAGLGPYLMARFTRLKVRGRPGPAKCPELLCPQVGVTSLWRGVMHHIRGHYPSFIAHTHSRARPKPSRRLQLSLIRRVFAGCRQSLLGDGPSRRYLRNPCMGAWTHTPQRLPGAFARFFPKSIGLTLVLRRSARQTPPALQLQQVTYFGAAVIPLCSGSHAR